MTAAQAAIALLDEAKARYQPAAMFALFSGGHDSLTSTHLAMSCGRAEAVVHCNTGVGIEETRQFVRDTCERQGWPLLELRAPEGLYDRRCLERGMPGGPVQHGIMYQLLKDNQLLALVRERKGRRGGTVGLITGVRASESARRMRVQSTPIKREHAQLWINPIHQWTALEVSRYVDAQGLQRNPVVDTLHRSGECLCGALADPRELDEIAFWYPAVAARLRDLERQCFDRGLPYRWGRRASVPIDPNQPMLPLCSSCSTRWEPVA